MRIIRKAYKTVCKRYPRICGNYRLISRLRRARDNKNLKKRGVRRLTARIAQALVPCFERKEKDADLQTLICSVFDKEKLSDEMIFLLEDAVAAAVLIRLAGCPENNEDAYLNVAQALMRQLEKLPVRQLYERYSAVNRILTRRNFHAYPRCDDESRAFLRSLVYSYAKRRRIPDAEAAKLIGEDCIRRRFDFRKRLFLWLTVTLTALFLLITLYVCGALETLFLLLPVLSLSFETVSAIASVAVAPSPILKLEAPEIEKKVVVVITTLLLSPDELPAFEKKLERMYLQNREKNVIFGLLCDYKDSKTPTAAGDEALRAAAKDAVARLNWKYPDRFCLFLRARSYAPGEKCYMGRERKRGALIDLCRYLKRKNCDFETVILPQGYRGQTSYLLTLDADTELRRGAVKKMYAALTHPSNKPILRGRVVVSGYGVIQPRMATSVENAGKTPFSALFSGGAGSGSYENAVFDFYQSVFGKGAFCGKGMFDLDVFDKVIVDRFPDGRILSHDLLEGTRLRCGYMSELTLTDSSPTTALSNYKRKHRWIRGDLQSFPFALRHLPFEQKKKHNPIGGVSKLMILSNVLRALTPVSSMLCLLFSTLLEEQRCAVFLFFTFGYLLLPLFLTVARTVKFVRRRFYSTVLQNVWQGIFQTLYAVCALSYEAYLSADALCRVLYRSLVSRRKLLEWVTAGEGEKTAKKKGKTGALRANLKAFLPSLPAAALLLFFFYGGVVRLLAVLFLLFPIAAFLLSLPFKEKKKISPGQIEILKGYARDSFAYFDRFVTAEDSFLPPDNYQEQPTAVLAHRTSPTNVALYLLSVVSMHDLGFLGEDAMLERLERTLNSVKSLPKYRGHLYNWYDTRSRDVLGQPFISTVDSGNFVLSLCALRGALKECGTPRAAAVERLAGELLDAVDFSFLYDRDAQLLSIGCDPVEEKRSEGCYDLLASEARSAYFYAIAKDQIPEKCWGKLGRALTVRDGHLGVLSWSGTAFEYFMPALFLPVYRNTLLYEALCFAAYEQIRDKTDHLWGRSESGFFAFDREMNYQYKAFGCASLAIDPDAALQDVIAPYASFLLLGLCVDAPLANLEKLRACGAKGAYGFYEAIDFTRSRVGRGKALIYSYMAHHTGMSIAAINNCVNDGILVRRVLRDAQLDAAAELLKESVPCDAPVSPLSKTGIRPGARMRFSLPGAQVFERHSPDFTLLFRKNTRVVSARDGRFSLNAHGMALTPPLLPDRRQRLLPSLFVCRSGKTHDLQSECTFCALDDREIVFSRIDRRFSSRTRILIDENGAVLLKVETSAHPGAQLLFFTPVILSTVEEYRAHPAFNGLCVEARYDENERLLLFYRRYIDDSRPGFCAGFAFADGGAFSFLSSYDDLPPAFFADPAGSLFSARFSCRTGTLRKPFCAIRRELDGAAGAELLILSGKSEKEVKRRLAFARAHSGGENGGYCRYLIRENKRYRRSALDAEHREKDEYEYLSLLLNGILHFRRPTPLRGYPVDELWRFGISGDRPIFTVSLPGKQLCAGMEKILKGLLCAHARLRRAGVKCDLVLLTSEDDRYFSPAEKAFEALLCDTVGLGEKHQNEGLFFLTDRRAAEVLPSFSRAFVTLEEDCVFPVFKKRFLSCLQPDETENESVQPLPGKAECKNTADCGESPRDENEPEAANAPEKENTQTGAFAAGGVVFDDRALRVSRSVRTPPFSYIYCGKQFGTMLTDGSLGFTWFRNAGEFRLTPFSGDETEGFTGERLFLDSCGGRVDLCKTATEVSFEEGCAVFSGRSGGLSYRLSVGCALKYPVKLLVLRLKNESDEQITGELLYAVRPCLGRLPDGNVSVLRAGDTAFFKRSALQVDLPFALYVCPEKHTFVLPAGRETEQVFLLGVYHPDADRCYYAVREIFSSPGRVHEEFRVYAAFYKKVFSRFTLRSGERAFDAGLNRHFPYQTLTARLWGRTGFYQPGGAYGFRDQLQDAMCLALYLPSELKYQILRCAAHQYKEGDVQHWWHTLDVKEGLGDRGVRTHCSDDLLFLPLAAARYLMLTGDFSLLDKKIRYLSSPPLANERDRYERPVRTARSESVYFHCLRAIDRASSERDERGLLKMGGGDWNDGLSAVGGGSVWLTQFFTLVVRRFLPFAREEDRTHLTELSDACARAVESCFEEGRYLRAFFPSGKALGGGTDDCCQIDLLPQAFAVFAENRYGKQAIETAYAQLWDKKASLFRLFSPAYDCTGAYPGYLAGYCPGFRENGGQYTHAAIWGAMALLRAGAHEKGFETLRGVNPIYLSAVGDNYRLEPYALAGDVYAAEGFSGRGGWSQYTGAAGWYIFALLSDLLGYVEDKDGFCLHPRLSTSFPSFCLEVRKKGTFYRIEASLGAESATSLDGKPCENRFFFDGGTHIVKIFLQNQKK